VTVAVTGPAVAVADTAGSWSAQNHASTWTRWSPGPGLVCTAGTGGSIVTDWASVRGSIGASSGKNCRPRY
jgi:hypothetical protein